MTNRNGKCALNKNERRSIVSDVNFGFIQKHREIFSQRFNCWMHHEKYRTFRAFHHLMALYSTLKKECTLLWRAICCSSSSFSLTAYHPIKSNSGNTSLSKMQSFLFQQSKWTLAETLVGEFPINVSIMCEHFE